jgi:hypothetical protein
VLLLILSAFNRRSGVAQFTPMCTRIPKRAIKVYLENAGAACVTRKGTSCSQRSEALKAHRKDRCRLSLILPPIGYVFHYAAPFSSMLILIMCNAQTPAFVESLYIPPAPLKCTAFRDCHINPLPAIDQRIVVLEGMRRTMPTLSQEERASLAAPSPTGAGLPADSIGWLGRMLPLQQVLNIHLVC